MRAGIAIAAFFLLALPKAYGLDLVDDLRIAAPTGQAGYLDGGLGKFRYGGQTRGRFSEAVAQIDWRIGDGFAVALRQ